MNDERATAVLIGGVGLLESAINYTLGSLHNVTSEALSRPTPCRHWDLRALLSHLDDSLLALHEAIESGDVDLDAPAAERDGWVDPVGTVRDHARQLVGAWVNADDGHHRISIEGSPLTAGIVTSTGAVEVTVHGWDVARACGAHRPIPRALAEELLEFSSLLVTDADRSIRFAAPVPAGPLAGPGDRLVAFLGRQPG